MVLDLKKLNINKLSKQKIILIILGIITVLYIALTSFVGDKKVEVSSIKTSNATITKTINLSGMVYSKDMDEMTVTPNVKVMKVYVKENEYVESGKLLAELDTSDLEINLEKSEISLEL